MVFVHSTEEVEFIVHQCVLHRTPVIPFGVGTSVEGNFAAVRGGVCVDFSQMNQILRVSTEDLDCTVQAGVRRLQLNQHLRDQGLFFPIDPCRPQKFDLVCEMACGRNCGMIMAC